MEYHVYIGTYTEEIHFASGKIVYGQGKGIYHYRMDVNTGDLISASTPAGSINPSDLAISSDHKILYAANERKESDEVFGGTVSAFLIGEDGALSFLNRQYTGGIDPCYVTVNDARTQVYVCNYGSGSIAVFPLAADGSLRPRSQLVQHSGGSLHPTRQSGPHAHSLLLSSDNRLAYALDLGTDRLEVYECDCSSGRLNVRPDLSMDTKAGTGPRHAVWHPDGNRLYVINELDSTVQAYALEARTGRLALLGTAVPTLLGNFTGENTCADIHISPDGNFLYGSNRGNGTLAVYRIRSDGTLNPVEQVSSGGLVPRSFALDPTGRFLLAANQNSDNLSLFAIEPATGRLRLISQTAVPNPVCVKIAVIND
ncbi:lactonase family protein [Marasmitruncus massiliensis]|uniref:lactonase family protein n=1 Tax=Marasmitruncus massiliensis TaxID=1944642 RepID=UPI000C7D7BB4|nr:lactonase family protein [Marasmitruncus massiliensis]